MFMKWIPQSYVYAQVILSALYAFELYWMTWLIYVIWLWTIIFLAWVFSPNFSFKILHFFSLQIKWLTLIYDDSFQNGQIVLLLKSHNFYHKTIVCILIVYLVNTQHNSHKMVMMNPCSNILSQHDNDIFVTLLYPPNNEVVGGYIGFTPSVRPSVCPNNANTISFIQV